MEDKKNAYSDMRKCKYCGKYPTIITNDKDSVYSVACSCYMKTGIFFTKEKAVVAWNAQNNPVKDTKIREQENYLAKLIAAVVRNAMESFHCKYLSDAQMKELNPIIRNAIYTALVKLDEDPTKMGAYYEQFIPDYWEDCELL